MTAAATPTAAALHSGRECEQAYIGRLHPLQVPQAVRGIRFCACSYPARPPATRGRALLTHPARPLAPPLGVWSPLVAATKPTITVQRLA